MINLQWIETAPSSLVMVVLSGLGIYAAMLVFTRIASLRSFSKMSSFDFAITVAMGSVIASTLLNKQPSLAAGMTGPALLYVINIRSRAAGGFPRCSSGWWTMSHSC